MGDICKKKKERERGGDRDNVMKHVDANHEERIERLKIKTREKKIKSRARGHYQDIHSLCKRRTFTNLEGGGESIENS